MRRSFGLLALLLAADASAYTLLGNDWTWQSFPCEEPWTFDPDGFPSTAGTEDELHTAFANAMEVWNDADANFVWIDGGVASGTASYSWDGSMVASYYSSISGGTLAMTSVWGTSTEIGECDMYFFGQNDYGTISWSSDPSGAGSSEYDLERVAIHELGHCLGLDHSASSSAIMYYATGPGTGTSGRVLHSDDEDGILAIYGPAEPFLEWSDQAVDDDSTGSSSGDGDGIAERGETIEIDIEVANSGTGDGTGLVGTIAESSADLTVTDASSSFDDAPEGGTAWTTSPFVVSISAACAKDQNVSFDLDVVDGDGNTFSDRFRVSVVCVFDADGDGYDDTVDCDDTNAAVNPGATEIWYDGIDQNCTPDDENDRDADGFDTADYGGDDCDDTNAAIHPGAAEVCDGVDQDCDGTPDQGLLIAVWADADGDDYGDPAAPAQVCALTPGWAGNDQDCDDADATVFPGAEEVCNDADDDCDGAPDDGLDCTPEDTDLPEDTDVPEDTDPPADTDPVEDTDPDVIAEEPKACGCATQGPSSGWMLLAATAVLARRSRRR
jgi:hypothetical protein